MHRLPHEDLDFMCDQTAELWPEMAGQRIFLTGGTGFFGCWLVESFLAANRRFQLHAQMVVLTRSPEAFQKKCPHLADDPALHFVRGDVRDFTFPDGAFPFVIHAATETSAKLHNEQLLQMLSTILDGTRRTLEFAAEHGTKKFLLISSGAVYGRQPEAISHLSEEYAGAPDSLQPDTAYANGKRTAELMCMLYARSTAMEMKIARCFAFVGPHLPLDTHFAIGNFIRDAMLGGPIRVNGDGVPKRSYLYASDLSIWLWTMLFRAPSGVAFNVGSEEAVSIRELAGIATEAIDPSISVEVAQAPRSGSPLLQYVPSVDRAREQLQLKAHILLKEAIWRTAVWYGHTGRRP
ncbi:MAG TPA: NAD(P)-dependent oxidoreductase, partial [Acidobacteriaceae bacterium]|nr:NAD(P)-dependent oxidoreductase [Acidobacteriaceae bacterium]